MAAITPILLKIYSGEFTAKIEAQIADIEKIQQKTPLEEEWSDSQWKMKNLSSCPTLIE